MGDQKTAAEDESRAGVIFMTQLLVAVTEEMGLMVNEVAAVASETAYLGQAMAAGNNAEVSDMAGKLQARSRGMKEKLLAAMARFAKVGYERQDRTGIRPVSDNDIN